MSTPTPNTTNEVESIITAARQQAEVKTLQNGGEIIVTPAGSVVHTLSKSPHPPLPTRLPDRQRPADARHRMASHRAREAGGVPRCRGAHGRYRRRRSALWGRTVTADACALRWRAGVPLFDEERART